MKHNGKFVIAQDGRHIAVLDGTVEFGDQETDDVCMKVAGQLCFPFLDSMLNENGQDLLEKEIPKAPPASEPEQLALDGSTSHRLRLDLEFSLPKDVGLTNPERDSLCHKTAEFFSYMVNEIISLKTGVAHAIDFEKMNETIN